MKFNEAAEYEKDLIVLENLLERLPPPHLPAIGSSPDLTRWEIDHTFTRQIVLVLSTILRTVLDDYKNSGEWKNHSPKAHIRKELMDFLNNSPYIGGDGVDVLRAIPFTTWSHVLDTGAEHNYSILTDTLFNRLSWIEDPADLVFEVTRLDRPLGKNQIALWNLKNNLFWMFSRNSDSTTQGLNLFWDDPVLKEGWQLSISTHRDGSGNWILDTLEEEEIDEDEDDESGQTQVYANVVRSAIGWGQPLWITTIPLRKEDPILGLLNWWW